MFFTESEIRGFNHSHVSTINMELQPAAGSHSFHEEERKRAAWLCPKLTQAKHSLN